MKTVSSLLASLLFLLCISGFAYSAQSSDSTNAEIKKQLQDVEVLDKALTDGGISNLLATCRAQSIPCPLIHSKYYSDLLSRKAPEEAALESAKRDFGLHLAKLLELTATELRESMGSQERESKLTELLVLSEWVASAKGYGNYTLVHRCENLAAVQLAYLAFDLQYPIAEIDKISARFVTEAQDRDFRVSVLNAEAPKPFISKGGGTDEEQASLVAVAWAKASNSAVEALKQTGVPRDKWTRSLLPEELAFFVDELDAIRGPETTVHLWNYKLHGGLVYGHRRKLFSDVLLFVKYRRLVGYFPTEPPVWWKPGTVRSSIVSAFDEAWRPYELKEGPIFDTAARIYQEVQSNKISDWDSQQVR